MSEDEKHSSESAGRSWTRHDTRGALAFAAEVAGWAILVWGSPLPYKALGGLLVLVGFFLWGGPSIREAIARERARANRRNDRPPGGGSEQVVEQEDAPDEART